MNTLRRLSILLVVCIVAGGCAVFPRSRFDEASESLPEVRAYALEHLKDLTPQEREIVRSEKPRMAQANFVVYYFRWQDATGKTFATVEASRPPCKPYAAARR